MPPNPAVEPLAVSFLNSFFCFQTSAHMFSFRFLNASHFQTSAHTAVSHALRSSCQNELNDDAQGVLRAAAKPGLAIEP